ncbi:hypothetical protein FI667_g13482, partial [Globisporangium splendens]
MMVEYQRNVSQEYFWLFGPLSSQSVKRTKCMARSTAPPPQSLHLNGFSCMNCHIHTSSYNTNFHDDCNDVTGIEIASANHNHKLLLHQSSTSESDTTGLRIGHHLAISIQLGGRRRPTWCPQDEVAELPMKFAQSGRVALEHVRQNYTLGFCILTHCLAYDTTASFFLIQSNHFKQVEELARVACHHDPGDDLGRILAGDDVGAGLSLFKSSVDADSDSASEVCNCAS